MKSEVKKDIESLLAEGNVVQIKISGNSMSPTLTAGRDEAVIAPAEPERIKRGDVVLYKRNQEILVLHRICRHTKKGFYFVGDSQVEAEGPLPPEQIIGVMVAFVRNGRTISAKQPVYVAYGKLLLALRPLRRRLREWKNR